jgi:thiosulfate/3-mercaptopyruvate sulfurtransferase
VINKNTLHGKALLWILLLGLFVGLIIIWVIVKTPFNTKGESSPVTDAQPVQVPGPLVETAWLADNLNNVVVLDVRPDEASFKKRSGGRSGGPVNPCGAKAHKGPFSVSGHIPGAVLVLWKNLIETRQIVDVEVKYLVPSKASFEELMQKSGVNNKTAIVITSNGESLGDAPLTTRLYWTLKYFGHDNVTILDGGTARWIKEKRDVNYGSSEAKLGNFKASQERTDIRATTDDVLKVSKGGDTQLVDAREQEVYLGLSYSAEFVAAHAKGHIPGAKNLPLELMVNHKDKMKTFHSNANISQVAALMKVNTDSSETIFYCNTGAYSSLGWFVWHELLGNKNTRLYDGSMHEWSQDANRPVTGLKFE